MGNRRKFLRVSFEDNFELKTKTWSDPSAKGLDISLNGCRFHCEQFLSEDESVSLNFRPSFELKGKIRWCWPIEWYYLAAVHFENISEQEQKELKSYIEEVTGENYLMEKENTNEIIEVNDEDNDEMDLEDIDDISDLAFDVVGEDKNEDGEEISDLDFGDEFEDLPQLSEEDLEESDEKEEELGNPVQNNMEERKNKSNELNFDDTNSVSNVIPHENISHKFADSDLTPSSFKGKHILIFDMLKEQAGILSQYLFERLGLEVDCVSKKQNLWRHLKIDPVEMIIIESGSYSNSDPLEVMQQTEDQFPGISYLCISGPVSLEKRMQFLNAGAIDYITRPIHLSSIAQSILIHLSKKDFYKKEKEIENLVSNDNDEKNLIENHDSNETFHDEDLTEILDLTDKDIDLSREIELIDKDF